MATERQVASRAGVYDILNRLSFREFETPTTGEAPLARLRRRWQRQNLLPELPFRGRFL